MEEIIKNWFTFSSQDNSFVSLKTRLNHLLKCKYGRQILNSAVVSRDLISFWKLSFIGKAKQSNSKRYLISRIRYHATSASEKKLNWFLSQLKASYVYRGVKSCSLHTSQHKTTNFNQPKKKQEILRIRYIFGPFELICKVQGKKIKGERWNSSVLR